MKKNKPFAALVSQQYPAEALTGDETTVGHRKNCSIYLETNTIRPFKSQWFSRLYTWSQQQANTELTYVATRKQISSNALGFDK